MKEFALTAKDKLKRIDPILLFCTLAMNLMSVITLAASSDAYGTWYVKAQILASVIGISAMIIISIAVMTLCSFIFCPKLFFSFSKA